MNLKQEKGDGNDDSIIIPLDRLPYVNQVANDRSSVDRDHYISVMATGSNNQQPLRKSTSSPQVESQYLQIRQPSQQQHQNYIHADDSYRFLQSADKANSQNYFGSMDHQHQLEYIAQDIDLDLLLMDQGESQILSPVPAQLPAGLFSVNQDIHEQQEVPFMSQPSDQRQFHMGGNSGSMSLSSSFNMLSELGDQPQQPSQNIRRTSVPSVITIRTAPYVRRGEEQQQGIIKRGVSDWIVDRMSRNQIHENKRAQTYANEKKYRQDLNYRLQQLFHLVPAEDIEYSSFIGIKEIPLGLSRDLDLNRGYSASLSQDENVRTTSGMPNKLIVLQRTLNYVKWLTEKFPFIRAHADDTGMKTTTGDSLLEASSSSISTMPYVLSPVGPQSVESQPFGRRSSTAEETESSILFRRSGTTETEADGNALIENAFKFQWY